MEFIQAGVQLYLSSTGILCSLSMLICHNLYADGDDKDFKQSAQPPNGGAQGTVPAFLSLSRQNVSTHTRASNRLYNRAPIGIPPTGGDSSDQQVGGNTMDDRLRPMTPRRVKRRSARSIQSQRFGPPTGPSTNQKLDGGDNSNKPSTSKGSSGGSARSSLRSNASRRNHRSSKRKNHFVSPVNRLMQLQHVVDSETSHDEPRRYLLRDQVGRFNMNLWPCFLLPHISTLLTKNRVIQIPSTWEHKVQNTVMHLPDLLPLDLPTPTTIQQDFL